MICNIRDDSPNNVAAALDSVLEVLRSSELYAPHLLQHFRDDKVVNDLVEGLMTVSAHSHVMHWQHLGCGDVVISIISVVIAIMTPFCGVRKHCRYVRFYITS